MTRQSVYGETWEFANSPLLIRFHRYCTLWCMCLAWTHLYYHGLQIIYIFFTPSLPSTIISLYTNLRKCSHFSCIWLFPTLFSGLQFTEVLIYVSAQIVFCFSQWEPCQANSVLTHFYYSPRHFFFFKLLGTWRFSSFISYTFFALVLESDIPLRSSCFS